MPRELFYSDAIREALSQEMRRDDSVYIFGEDVAAYGGVFGVTRDLLQEFGPMRVRNTPSQRGPSSGRQLGQPYTGCVRCPKFNLPIF